MKTVSLYIKNIGLIGEELIKLDKSLILFFGEIRQGKTTILNAVRYVFGGAFPTDLLKHGEAEGEITLTFDTAVITRTFYRAEDGTVKARPLVYVVNGERVLKPVDALKKLINPFLLDQDFLIRMTELERKKYFVVLFDADTSELDNKLVGDEAKASLIRAELRGFGNIDLTEHPKPDLDTLKANRAALDVRNGQVAEQNKQLIANVDAWNKDVEANEQTARDWDNEVIKLQAALNDAIAKRNLVRDWLTANPKQAYRTPMPLEDSSKLDEAISNAKAAQVLHEQYLKNKAQADRRDNLGTDLSVIEADIRETRKLKVEALKRINDNGIPGLVFGDNGSFTFEDTQAGMLSTSQMMKLSTQLSALYPEGIGIDLIDRAESLGKSIFGYIDRAKQENKTILATIVGERPANAPDDVGVFVVEGGKVS